MSRRYSGQPSQKTSGAPTARPAPTQYNTRPRATGRTLASWTSVISVSPVNSSGAAVEIPTMYPPRIQAITPRRPRFSPPVQVVTIRESPVGRVAVGDDGLLGPGPRAGRVGTGGFHDASDPVEGDGGHGIRRSIGREQVETARESDREGGRDSGEDLSSVHVCSLTVRSDA